MSGPSQGKYCGNVSPRPSIKSYKTANRRASEFDSKIDIELKLANHSGAFSGAECISDTFPTETVKSYSFRCEESNLSPNVNEEAKVESGNLNEWEANSEMAGKRSKGKPFIGASQGKRKDPIKKDVGEAKASRYSDDVNGNSDSDGAGGDAGSTVHQDNESHELKNKIQHSQTSNEKERERGSIQSLKPSQMRHRKNNTEDNRVPQNIPTSKETVGKGIYRLLNILLVLVLVALLVGGIFLHVYKLKPPATDENPTLQAFQMKLKQLKSRFSSQREELWKRSKILLEKHLLSAQPSEPASMILTSGQSAQKTLHCLASQLAEAYSSALNASVVQMDGSGLSSVDSDQVKLLLDEKLKSSFEGNKRTAVIHRLEELPPGATLIFYKYCDHENAAYKAVALIFTVLLDEEELTPGLNLGAVEEKVRDYIQKKFINSEQPDAFNRMDADKLGGLWSRISHLILPVTAEMGIENQGCDSADSK
ncbi:torsin-1A-interacting protein 2-like isoform X2 [Acipenser ruthenus]|uniref:torsin-1A-interacting protein 2-like isoform X2 n=1 Tax=Acipenser ruthenus TaxID=7906 RepID=UPI00145BD683|nr:torsin-1A-interacting protein 2-like isoform X2 [Acipenser ruthenus]